MVEVFSPGKKITPFQIGNAYFVPGFCIICTYSYGAVVVLLRFARTLLKAVGRIIQQARFYMVAIGKNVAIGLRPAPLHAC
jgi:hypothetical protein